MTPVKSLMLNPGGRPDAVNVMGDVPPAVVSVVVYAFPGAPEGRDVVVIVGPLLTVKKQTGVPYVVPAEFVETSW